MSHCSEFSNLRSSQLNCSQLVGSQDDLGNPCITPYITKGSLMENYALNL